MFQTLAPPEDLQPYVRFFWMTQGSAGRVCVERVIPDGCCELIWQLAAPFQRLSEQPCADHQPAAFVFGQIENAIRLQPLGDIDVFGVRLAPAGLAALWGVDVSAIGPRECSLDELFPERQRLSIEHLRSVAGAALRDLDQAAANAVRRAFIDRCAMASRWLRFRLRRTDRPQPKRAMAALSLMESGMNDIQQIARKIGSSRRGVERAFRVAVGLSPATYLRLRRIDYCSRMLRRDAWGLAAIAAAAGYADHAHFSREFHSIVGISPGAYRREVGSQSLLIQ